MKPRLLLVEDDRDTLALLEMAARRSGLFSEIMLARDGQEALASLAVAFSSQGKPLPDLIVTDLKMPRINGLELTVEVKVNPRTKHVPVVILTSSDLAKDRDAAVRAGCSGFFTKPGNVGELIDVFRAICQSRVAKGAGEPKSVQGPIKK